jgi:hypothetical protein
MYITPEPYAGLLVPGQSKVRQPIFKALWNTSGQARVSREFDLDGQQVNPLVLCSPDLINTGDDSWPAWDGDSDGLLTQQVGAGIYDVPSLLGVGGGVDEMVTLSGVIWWRNDASTTYGNITTGDTIIEYFGDVSAATDTILSKRDGEGWSVLFTTSKFQVQIQDASGSVAVSSAVLPTGSNLIHAMAILRRSGYGQIYINNVASGPAVDISARAGSLANSGRLALGANSAGSFKLTGTIGQVGVWTGTATWLSTHLQEDFVKARFQQHCGIYPQLAPAGAYSLTCSRASPKYYYRSDQGRLHLAGAGMVVIDDRGLEVWDDVTNVNAESEDRTQYTNDNSTDADGGSESPIVGVNWNRMVEDDSDNAHGMKRQANSAPAQNEHFVVQAFMKAGDRYGTLRTFEVGNAKAAINIDLSDGSVVASADDGSYTLHDYGVDEVTGNGYLAWIEVSDSDAVPLAPYGQLLLADSESLSETTYDSYQGDSSGYPLGILWQGVQIVIGAGGPQPYVATDGSPVTVNAADCDANSAIAEHIALVGEVTIECKIIKPSRGVEDGYIVSVDDGSGGTNRIQLYVDDADGKVKVYVGASGTQAWFSVVGDVCDDAEHDVSLSLRTDHVSLIVDGVEGVDTSCTMPTGMDTFRIGRHINDTAYFGGHIFDMVVYLEALH